MSIISEIIKSCFLTPTSDNDRYQFQARSENLILSNKLPQYRILSTKNSHNNDHDIMYKVEVSTKDGWVPCFECCEDIMLEVKYSDRERCEKWINKQKRKFTPEIWEVV